MGSHCYGDPPTHPVWERFAPTAPIDGTFSGRAYVRDNANLGLLGFGGRQSADDFTMMDINQTKDPLLKFYTCRDYVFGLTGNVNLATNIVEIEFKHNGLVYKLRYAYKHTGIPTNFDTATIKYVDLGTLGGIMFGHRKLVVI